MGARAAAWHNHHRALDAVLAAMLAFALVFLRLHALAIWAIVVIAAGLFVAAMALSSFLRA